MVSPSSERTSRAARAVARRPPARAGSGLPGTAPTDPSPPAVSSLTKERVAPRREGRRAAKGTAPRGQAPCRSDQAGSSTPLEIAGRHLDPAQLGTEPLVARGVPGARIRGNRLGAETCGIAHGAQLLETTQRVEHVAIETRKRLGDRLVRVHAQDRGAPHHRWQSPERTGRSGRAPVSPRGGCPSGSGSARTDPSAASRPGSPGPPAPRSGRGRAP